MTAAAVPGRVERAAARPVPWIRLAWVTWRQHRAALAGAVDARHASAAAAATTKSFPGIVPTPMVVRGLRLL